MLMDEPVTNVLLPNKRFAINLDMAAQTLIKKP